MAEQALVTVEMDATIEEQLEKSGAAAVQTAKAFKITSQEDYEQGGKYLTGIKTRMKQISEYWKPAKEAADKAHKQLVAKEKQMLKPLQEAESIIKRTMLTYQQAVEKARREAEAEARRRQEEEARRLLEEAVKAEEKGDDQAAAIHMAMAEVVSDMPAAPVVEKPTAQGTSIRKTRKARVVDEKLVPAYFNGMELRSINMSVLNSLAKTTKGTMQIPGVEFYEEAALSVRT